jgi:hypothetical protein
MPEPAVGEERDAINAINVKWEMASKARAVEIQKKRLDLDYYLGEQRTYIDRYNNYLRPTYESLRQLRQDKGFHFVTVNLCEPAVAVVHANFTKSEPQLYALVNARGDNAKDVSKVATDMLTYYRFREQGLADDFEAKLWAIVTGDAYKWPQPLQVDGETKIVTTVHSPFEAFPCPGVKRMRDMPWFIFARYMQRSTVENDYDIKLKEGVDQEIYTVEQDDKDIALISGEKRGDQVLMIEYFEKPSKKRPEGRHALVCQNFLLKDNIHPYWNDTATGRKWGGYRITHYQFKPSMHSHWGKGLIRDAIIIQKKYNLMNSYLITNISKTAPKLYHDPRLKLTQEDMSNVTSAVPKPPNIETPSYGDAAVIPPQAMDMKAELLADFERVTGVHELAKGEPPEKRMPFQAIRFSTEMDLLKFIPAFSLYEEAEREFGYDYLWALKQFAHQCAYRRLSSARIGQVENFLMDDLTDPEVFVEPGSSIPSSIAGRVAEMMELAHNNGPLIMGDKFGMISYMRHLGTKWSLGMVEEYTGPFEWAKEENQMMLKGERVMPNMFQEDDIHMRIHSRLLDGEDYRRIRGTVIEQIIVEHLMATQQIMASKMPPPPMEGGAPPPEQGPPPMEGPGITQGPPPQPGPSPLEQQLLGDALGVPVEGPGAFG